MSQIPSAVSVQARRAREQHESCPVCQTRLVTGIHVERCEEERAYLDRSRTAGTGAGVPQVATDDLHAHLITRCHNPLIAALVVELVIDLGWRPVVGSDSVRLWQSREGHTHNWVPLARRLCEGPATTPEVCACGATRTPEVDDDLEQEDTCPAGQHDWTSRPESDTWVCDFCGAER